jgi:hypothetical protein
MLAIYLAHLEKIAAGSPTTTLRSGLYLVSAIRFFRYPPGKRWTRDRAALAQAHDGSARPRGKTRPAGPEVAAAPVGV